MKYDSGPPTATLANTTHRLRQLLGTRPPAGRRTSASANSTAGSARTPSSTRRRRITCWIHLLTTLQSGSVEKSSVQRRSLHP